MDLSAFNGQGSLFKFFPTVVNIEGNLLFLDNTLIQLSSVSHIYIGRLPKKPLPWAIVLAFAVVGTGLILTEPYNIIGFIAAGVSLLILLLYFLQNNSLALNLSLSSGAVASFISPDENFLKEVARTLQNVLSNPDRDMAFNIDFINKSIMQEGPPETLMPSERKPPVKNVSTRKMPPLYDNPPQGASTKPNGSKMKGVKGSGDGIDYLEFISELKKLHALYMFKAPDDKYVINLIIEAQRAVERGDNRKAIEILQSVPQSFNEIARSFSLHTLTKVLAN